MKNVPSHSFHQQSPVPPESTSCFDTAPLTPLLREALWEMDLTTGHITYQNGFDAIFGESPTAGKPFAWWFPKIRASDRDAAIQGITAAFKCRAHQWRETYWFKHAGGHYKFIQDSGHIIYVNRKAVRLIGIFQDLTMMKELEMTLANERLERQQKLAETVIRITEKERSRLGLELHDNVNQLLACSVLFLDTIQPQCEKQISAKIKSRCYMMTAVEEIRKLSKALVMPSLAGADLVSSIEVLSRDIELASTLSISFTHSFSETKLSSGKRLAIYRIIQEQLKNILKHSQASTAHIHLETDNHFVILAMKDNGVGKALQSPCTGIGLTNILERAKFYGGTVEIVSSIGQGFELTVRIPRKKAMIHRDGAGSCNSGKNLIK